MTEPTKLIDGLNKAVPAYSLAVFRILFGIMGFLSALRVVANGWVHTLYIEPSHHFKYLGFEWIVVPPGWMLYAIYGALALVSLAVAAGAFFRVAMPVFFLLFTYLELLDQTYYLNHYYFMSLCSLLMCFMPMSGVWSVDATLKGEQSHYVPQWTVWALRLQFVILYFFAGVAKINPDWLLEAEPLRTWLLARTETPLIGSFLSAPWLAYAMSYAGIIFDLSIGFLLLSQRARPYAYLAVVLFHLGTAALFNIGLFPWVMIALTPIFFEPAWPLKIPGAKATAGSTQHPRRLPRLGLALMALYFLVQVALPLRHHLIDNNVLWSEDGYLFSWRVMLTEKTGVTDFYAENPDTGRRWLLSTCGLLTPVQKRKMSANPDFIVQTARWLHEDLKSQELGHARIHAESYASLNGNPSQRMIDPRVDLARVERSWGQSHWVLPMTRQSGFTFQGEPGNRRFSATNVSRDSTIKFKR